MYPSRKPFYHTPPPGVQNRWPGSWDWQYFQDTVRPQTLVPCPPTSNGSTTTTGTMHVTIPVCSINLPTFMDVAAIMFSCDFIDAKDASNLVLASPILTKHSVLLPTWIAKPWQPMRKRHWGFGKVDRDRSCTHDKVNPRSVIHSCWKFLSPGARLQVVRALPQLRQYAHLRKSACVTSLSTILSLKTTRQKPIPTTLDKQRAWWNTVSLLRFDFDYGDFARWMGGEFTNRRRNWNSEYDKMEKVFQRRSLPLTTPPVRLDLAYRIQTEGVPLRAHYCTSMSATALREQYDNHPAVAQNFDKVEEKFAKEEWNTFHVHFLRFAYEFIPGLVINPIQWVWDKGKGRLCIDCTNGPDPAGAVNSYIPKPKEGVDLECPKVFYQHAFHNFLQHVMRMRITCPKDPILVHADDIEAAFRRVLYHPDAAIAFSYVYSDYLMVPVGQVFGSRNAPSFYCVLADVRQGLAACLPDRDPSEMDPLATGCKVKVDTSSPLTPVPPDSHHTSLTPAELDRTFNSSYVDDNAVAQFEAGILQAIDHSVQSAFDVFGTGDTRRGDCLQQQKWTEVVSEEFMYLGFMIDTHTMNVSWPLAKRQRLHDDLTMYLARTNPKPYVTPREMASVIGVVRSAATIAPWGNFLSFNLQNSLNRAAKRTMYTRKRHWWNKSKIYLSPIAIQTMRQLLDKLLEAEGSPLWSRPIALFLDRDHTHRVYSDASYGGLGGWSSDFGFLWRLTRDDLAAAGFDMKTIVLQSLEPTDPKLSGLHINPLEYIGIVINLWLTLKFVEKGGPIDGGYVLALFADNTSALSWMSTASRTKNPTLQGLARLGAALLVAAAERLTKVCPLHIPGIQNIIADALSRPPTAANPSQNVLDSVIAQWSPLATCPICLLPSELLSTIASVISSPPTGEQYGDITTELLTLEPKLLPIGVRTWDSPSTIY